MRLSYNWRDDYLVTTSAYQTSGAYDNLTNVSDTTDAGHVNTQGDDLLRPAGLRLSRRNAGREHHLPAEPADHLGPASLEPDQYDVPSVHGLGRERTNRSWYTADRRYTTKIHFRL